MMTINIPLHHFNQLSVTISILSQISSKSKFFSHKIRIKNPIITARKRSLRRLCFYRCLSVHMGGACVVLFGRACVVLFGGCVVLFGGRVWFYSGGACMVLFGGHAWFYSGGRAWFYLGGRAWFYLGGHVWFYSGGACVVLFRGWHA